MEGKVPTRMIVLSVSIMLIGSLIAGWGDLGFDPTSYAYVIGNNLCTALYLVTIKRVTAVTKLSSFGIMVYNSTLSIPLLLICELFSGEYLRVAEFEFLCRCHLINICS